MKTLGYLLPSSHSNAAPSSEIGASEEGRSSTAFGIRRLRKAQSECHEPFSYRPLDPSRSQFRLLYLQPGEGDDDVECYIRHVSFRKMLPRPRYETISYCWGNAAQRASIVLEGCVIFVPASSAAALRCMRSHKRTRILWIDAICINQGDNVERGSQVAMMSQIYSRSTGNLIYLGERDSLTETAIQNIKAIVQEVKEDTRNFVQVEGTPLSRRGASIAFRDLQLRCHVNENALSAIYNRLWFKRLWVFQEAALAPHSTCYVGPFQLQLQDILRTFLWVLDKPLHNALRFDGNPYALWEFVDNQFGIHSSDGGPLLWLEDLLKSTSERETSDPRDYVLGIVGMLQKHSPRDRSLITPNYEKSVKDVFRDATRYALLESQRGVLTFMRDCPSLEVLESGELPSWTPDYRRRWDISVDPVPFSQSFKSNALMFQLQRIDRFDEEDGVLRCRGRQSDRVDEITPAVAAVASSSDIHRHIMSVCQLVGTSIQDLEAMSMHDPIKRTVSFVLIAGITVERLRATEEIAIALDLLLSFFRINAESASSQLADAYGQQDNRSPIAFYRALQMASPNRKAFKTAQGYIGLGPKIMQPNDVEAIFYGNNWPYVLRPHGQYYRMVGSCYVYGIVDGEAVNRHKDEGRPDDIFQLV